MARKTVLLTSVVSTLFVYLAFLIADMFASMTYHNWVDMNFRTITDSDIANVQRIMDTMFYIPISAFTLHVLLIGFIYFRRRR